VVARTLQRNFGRQYACTNEKETPALHFGVPSFSLLLLLFAFSVALLPALGHSTESSGRAECTTRQCRGGDDDGGGDGDGGGGGGGSSKALVVVAILVVVAAAALGKSTP